MTQIVSTTIPHQQQNSQLLPAFQPHLNPLVFGPKDGGQHGWFYTPTCYPMAGQGSLRRADTLSGGMYVFEKDEDTLEDWPLLDDQEEHQEESDSSFIEIVASSQLQGVVR